MEVRTRAPGKIILSGEHAVVHGSTAVASSIDLFTYVSLRFPSEDDGTLKLQLKDLALEFSWSLERLKNALHDSVCPAPSTPASCSPELLKLLATLVEEQNIPEAKVGLPSGISAFLWLYINIQGYKPATVVITSDLPLGSGLGSSAALCVSVAAAMLALSNGISLYLGQKGWLTFGDNDLNLLNRWAFEGEKIIHGKPSGIDNTVSTYGNMIKFKSGILTRMKSNMPLKMLITNTKVGRNTKALVAGVSERALRYPQAMTSVFDAVDSISNDLAAVIQSQATDDEIIITEKEEKLEELMEMNQGILQCMGVSHVSIETVLRTTLKYKLASKLTGAGGGGCVITLIPTLLSRTVVDKVVAELESCGFQCLTAGIGGNGLELCFDGTS